MNVSAFRSTELDSCAFPHILLLFGYQNCAYQ
jgi:hypothetical protein